jgi:hypothetical protein
MFTNKSSPRIQRERLSTYSCEQNEIVEVSDARIKANAFLIMNYVILNTICFCFFMKFLFYCCKNRANVVRLF